MMNYIGINQASYIVSCLSRCK